jgi:hypothetical protein
VFDWSFSVFEKFEKISPGAAVRASSLPIRAAEAATSADTGAEDVHWSLSGFLPVRTVAGPENFRSKKPAPSRGVSGTFVVGWSQVVWAVRMSGCSIGSPSPVPAISPARSSAPVWCSGSCECSRPAADMFPRPVMKWRPTPPKRSSRLASNRPGQSGWASPPFVPKVVGCAAYAPTVAIVSPAAVVCLRSRPLPLPPACPGA